MSREDSDQVRGQEWLETLLHMAGLPAKVNVEYREDTLSPSNHLGEGLPDASELARTCWLTIDESNLVSDQVITLIGPDGSVLDAIQYLGNTILNLGQEQGHQRAFTIDLHGYRVQRQAALKAMAEEAAEKVRETGQEYELKSLSSAERRQVHTFLQNYPDLETYSRGREPDRRLVVRRVVVTES